MYSAQIIFTAIILFVIYRTLVIYKKGNLTGKFTLIWLMFWGTILFFLFRQDLLTKAANFLGIWRGVDMALYISVIVIFYLLFKTFALLEEINQKITQIIRRDAIKNPSKRNKNK